MRDGWPMLMSSLRALFWGVELMEAGTWWSSTVTVGPDYVAYQMPCHDHVPLEECGL